MHDVIVYWHPYLISDWQNQILNSHHDEWQFPKNDMWMQLFFTDIIMKGFATNYFHDLQTTTPDIFSLCIVILWLP